ncbi:hypothetical protein Bhyg_06906 [Pseudolycoriella hygida]|uniref:Uncharacterized protein n=1 Tax=Pseudolycoriella hygida TaxID=35572 RepID=A0A9Q0N360_9DIPT|nr:hypothetical protein Bhyg_06906 [Pseudolycoriella hygida]
MTAALLIYKHCSTDINLLNLTMPHEPIEVDQTTHLTDYESEADSENDSTKDFNTTINQGNSSSEFNATVVDIANNLSHLGVRAASMNNLASPSKLHSHASGASSSRFNPSRTVTNSAPLKLAYSTPE